MRWMWIDRIVEFLPQQRLVAVKNVSLAEEHLHDHFARDAERPPRPIMPASLIIEGMAQAAGILVGAARQFREKVILAKIASARLDREAGPGDTLRYEAELHRLDAAGAAASGTIHLRSASGPAWTAIGRVELLFSHIDRSLSGVELPAHNFVFGENLRVILETIGLGTSVPA